jgi:hypothetical protein
LFWSRRDTGVDERVKLMARMVTLIVHGLQIKSYEQFVESFSNPDGEPPSLEGLFGNYISKCESRPLAGTMP